MVSWSSNTWLISVFDLGCSSLQMNAPVSKKYFFVLQSYIHPYEDAGQFQPLANVITFTQIERCIQKNDPLLQILCKKKSTGIVALLPKYYFQ